MNPMIHEFQMFFLSRFQLSLFVFDNAYIVLLIRILSASDTGVCLSFEKIHPMTQGVDLSVYKIGDDYNIDRKDSILE